MSRVIIVESELPGQVLSPNNRAHWRKKAAAKRDLRNEVGWRAKVAMKGQAAFAAATMQATFYCDRSQCVEGGFYAPKDTDNALASIKAAIDGLVDGGVLRDDNAGQLTHLPVRIYRGKASGGRCGLVLEVREVSA